jgi:hypothetical protein
MISDDDLLLYHYRELDAADRARIGAALAADPELAQRLQSLVARLDAAAAHTDVPVPEATLQRWNVALERAARIETANAERHAPRIVRRFDFRWPAAAAVAIVALILVVPMATRDDQTAGVTPPVANTAEPVDPDAYERGLKWHLASTEKTLAGLDRASPEERARLIDTISAQNRMYALAAERAGEPQLARVLRAFAPILDSLGEEGGDSSAALAQLSFELRVMQGRLGADAHAAADSAPTTL